MVSSFPTVRQYMDVRHHAFHVDEPIVRAIDKLIDDGLTGAPVVDDQDVVVGMLTESECLALLSKGTLDSLPPTGTVKDFMNTDITPVPPQMDVYYLAGQFIRTGKRRFAVVDNGLLIGVITRKDLLRVLQKGLKDEPPA